MHRLSKLTQWLTLGFATLSVARSTSPAARVPVLLELFTSEGCSSCPPADQLLATLDEKQPEPGAELIVLSEHVDYFNSSAWKDPFSARLFTERQEAFSQHPGFDGVYTPQMVVDGRFGFVGSDNAAASPAIRKALRQPKIPLAISGVARERTSVSVRIDSAGDRDLKGAQGRVFIALTEERVESRVSGGENARRTLRHVAVVRELKSAATIDMRGPSTAETRFDLQPEWGAKGMRVVAFIQDPASGYVLGVAERKLMP